jgi:hypothetical protein
MKKILLLSALCSISFFACKKKTEDVPVPAPLEDYSLAGYLQKTGFNQKEFIIPQGSQQAVPALEIGIVIEPKVVGNITAFKVKFPSQGSGGKIIVWDAITAQPIASHTFNYLGASVGQETTMTVTPIPLEKNRKYCISYTNVANGFYFRERTDQADVTYPIEFKNLTILSLNGNVMSNVNLRQYPYPKVNNFYYGDVSFTFQ